MLTHKHMLCASFADGEMIVKCLQGMFDSHPLQPSHSFFSGDRLHGYMPQY